MKLMENAVLNAEDRELVLLVIFSIVLLAMLGRLYPFRDLLSPAQMLTLIAIAASAFGVVYEVWKIRRVPAP